MNTTKPRVILYVLLVLFLTFCSGMAENVTDLQELTNAINNASIATIFLGAGIYSMTSPLMINRDVTIEASDWYATKWPVVFDGNNETRHVDISNNASVILQGINFTNGYGSGAGGAINVVESSLYLKNCNLYKNYAPSSYGGALMIVDSEFSLYASTIFENTALMGGGIAIKDGTTLPNCYTYYNTQIYNNRALEGGNVWMDGGSTNSWNLFVEGGEATNGGGVLVMNGTFQTYLSFINNNVAEGGYGAGIVVIDGDVELVTSHIENNRGVTTNQITTGGGLAAMGGTTKVAYLLFENNTAGGGKGNDAFVSDKATFCVEDGNNYSVYDIVGTIGSCPGDAEQFTTHKAQE